MNNSQTNIFQILLLLQKYAQNSQPVLAATAMNGLIPFSASEKVKLVGLVLFPTPAALHLKLWAVNTLCTLAIVAYLPLSVGLCCFTILCEISQYFTLDDYLQVGLVTLQMQGIVKGCMCSCCNCMTPLDYLKKKGFSQFLVSVYSGYDHKC